MEQRRLPDLHLVGDVTGRGSEVAALGEQRRGGQQDATPRRLPVDWCGLPTLPVLHGSIVSLNRSDPGAERSIPLEESRIYRAVRNVRRSALGENRSVPIL